MDHTDVFKDLKYNNSDSYVTVALNEFVRYVVISVILTIIIVFVPVIVRVVQIIAQKTRTPAQMRMYVGSRARQSLSQTEPTIYVSPLNLPPPPKYECLAPPSYEEVVGIHYPQYQSQPITRPIAVAMAQASTNIDIHGTGNAVSSVNVDINNSPATTVNITSAAHSR